MARDQIEVDLLLNAKKAEATIKQMNRELGKMGKTMGQAFSGTGGGASNNIRALGTGLSKATVRADEFSKSLEASNARVIAFGASAGLIMNVDRALRAMVKTTIQVEKAMADVNVVMNISSKQLDQFGKGMFKVAKETAQGFSTVAEASTELARQGLGMEKTLARTKDALILTRLTGMNAADAVKSLTAAVNSFNKEGTTSSQVINRMAKVDAAFAVSSEDLAKAISRVGSSAVDAGVSLNQLMAITTSVQQKTARGGAVIGNAFKTIFTRIQRSDVRKTLSDIGVATTDMSGKMLDGVTVLENLSKSFGRLTKVQQASVAESVAGVFQVNILRAAMSDLSTKNSEYAKALRVANSATNEAYKRNEQLNQTLDALANKTMVNLTQAGAALGGDLFGPAIKKVLGTVNSTLESFGKGGAMEGIGQTIGKGLVTGIGNFIGGPGLIIATAVFGKLALNLSKFATTAFKDIMGINTAVKQRAALEEIVVNTLASEPALLQKVKMGTLSVLDVEKQILATIKQQQVERAALKGYGGAIAGSLYQRGTRVGSSGRAFNTGMGRMGKASGFVPNFANANSERAAAAAGGYTAGAIKTMSQPGAGTMMYNSAETVKQFPGMSQKAIMPPSNSSAGANYRSTFGAAHGFDPYAAGGFVPNSRGKSRRTTRKAPKITDTTLNAKNPIGVLLGEGPSEAVRKDYEQLLFAGPKNPTGKGSISGIAKRVSPKLVEAYQKGLVANPRVIIKDVLTKGVFPLKSGNIRKSGQSTSFKDEFEKLEKSLGNFAGSIQTEIFGKDGKDRTVGNVIDFMGSSAKGEIFEASIRAALKQSPSLLKGANKNAPFDFNPFKAPDEDLLNLFGLKNLARIEAKIGGEAANNIVSKYANEFDEEPSISNAAKSISQKIRTKKNNASGFIPNFSSPLGSSVGREMAAGIPASAIRVGSSPALRSSKNPSGLGVYNTKDEPMGLNQGISRSRSMGINPKTHGAAGGFVPNFMVGSDEHKLQTKAAMDQTKAAKENKATGKTMSNSADRIMMASMVLNMAASGIAAGAGAGQRVQSGINAVANISSMAGMGFAVSGGNPLGALAGAGIGVATSMGDIDTMLGGKDAEIAAEKMANLAVTVGASLDLISDSLNKLKDKSAPAETRIEAVSDVIKSYNEVINLTKGSTDPVVKDIAKSVQEGVDPRQLVMGGGADLSNAELEAMKTMLSRQKESAESVLNSKETPFSAFLRGNAGTGGIAEGEKVAKSIFNPAFQSRIVNAQIARQTAGGVEMISAEDELTDIKGIVKKVKKERDALRESPLTLDGKEFDFRTQMGEIRKLRLVEQAEPIRELFAQRKKALAQRSAAVSMVGNRSMEQASGRFAQVINAAGGNVYANELVGDEVDKDRRRDLMFGAFGMGESVGVPALVAPGVYGPPEPPPAVSEGMSQIAFDSRRREGRIRRAGRAAGKRAGITARIGNIRRDKASRDVLRANRGRMAGITMAGDSLIDEQGSIATKAAEDKARTTRTEIVVNQQGKLEQKNLKALDSMIDAVAQTAGNLETKNELIKKFNNEYKNLSEEDAKAKIKVIEESAKGEKPTSKAQDAELKFLEQRLIDLKENHVEQKGLLNEADKAREEEIKNIDAGTEARKKERKAMLEFQTDVRIQGIMDKATKTKNEAAGLRDLRDRGLGITEREIADADRAARRAAIRAGDSSGDPMAAFKESFAYGPKDAILEFEDGVVNVANTMKSSFADAFRAIASGSATAGEAIGAMAQSVLDSISQVSTNMFSSMLFQQMGMGGKAQGGYVPGYNSGGLITGGSGYKDDVPIRATGGEFVIKKSAVNKIGLPTLNSINGMANGGMSMGKVGLIAAGAGAASGVLSAAMQPGAPDVPRSQDYGMGRSKHGYLGGADPDARGADMISGGGGRAGVSLNKAYTYYRRDPQTGQLISERARPTEGRFEVSDNLSLLGRLGEDDPQTARMFQKEQAMSSYQGYLSEETNRRKAAVKAVKRQKRGRLIQAYANAAMLIGGARMMDKMAAANAAGGTDFTNAADPMTSSGMPQSALDSHGSALHSYSGPLGSHGMPMSVVGNRANGGMIATMGGEYVMSPEAVRTHGINFMTELNRGNVPGYASGGLVGSAPAAGGGGMVDGSTTNNVSINVNIDKNGKANADSSVTSQQGGPSERDQQEEIENNKEFGELLQGVVLQEIVKQQRPGGLLNRGTTGIPGGGY